MQDLKLVYFQDLDSNLSHPTPTLVVCMSWLMVYIRIVIKNSAYLKMFSLLNLNFSNLLILHINYIFILKNSPLFT